MINRNHGKELMKMRACLRSLGETRLTALRLGACRLIFFVFGPTGGVMVRCCGAANVGDCDQKAAAATAIPLKTGHAAAYA